MAAFNKTIILIVDARADTARQVSGLLAENGYQPVIASSCSDALAFLKTQKPYLILLDTIMPEMDGFSLCRTIKANKVTRYIPIIFLADDKRPEDVVEGFESGAVDYIGKPFHPVELLARVKTHVEMKILRGFLPICAICKKVREDRGLWTKIEEYLERHAEILLSHGICKECADRMYGEHEWYRDIEDQL